MSQLNISQALRRVKKLKGDLAQWLERAQSSVTHKDAEPPAFVFGKCMETSAALRQELLELTGKIAVTNANTLIEWENHTLSLTQAVHTLKELKGELAWLNELKSLVRNQDKTTTSEADYDYASEKRTRINFDWTCHLPEAKRAESASKVKERFDVLNGIVEDANHRTVLR